MKSENPRNVQQKQRKFKRRGRMESEKRNTNVLPHTMVILARYYYYYLLIGNSSSRN